MRPSEDNPVCQKCGLWEGCRSPFMKPAGSDAPKIIIIGEAPGEDEDRKGTPFMGKSGQLLREALEALDVDIEMDALFTNVVRCRPPDNKITKQAINACKQFAIDDIAFLYGDGTHGVEQVWLMGNSPLNGILGESGITSWAGVKVKKDGLEYVPMLHPAFVLRDMGRFDEWVGAMATALSGENDNSDRFEVIIPHTMDEVKAMVEDLITWDEISFDTETSTLDPFAPDALLLSVSFARPGRAYSVVLEHPDTWWSDKIEKKQVTTVLHRVAEQICAVLEIMSGKIIGHNVKFDQNQERGILGVEWQAYGDTMIISHLLDSRKGIHGLKHLAGLHLGMYEYEQELTDYIKAHKEANPRLGGSYANVPLDILLPYGAMDAEATLLLHAKLYQELSDKQKVHYRALVQSSNALAHVQFNGIKIDPYIADRYVRIYSTVMGQQFVNIRADAKVKKLVADRQRELDAEYEKALLVYKRKKKPAPFEFNPNSSAQVSDLYFHYYKIPSQGKTESGADSTNAKLMAPLVAKYPIVGLVRYYKLLSKMLGTYLQPACTDWLSADGRVRSTYNMHGTVTGRLSSSDPNLQNIPTPEKEPGTLLESLPIKNIFTHTFKGGCLMSLDYSGMELRVFASLANCKRMIDIHYSGRDFHSMVAIMAQTHKDLDDITAEDIAALPKPVRYRYKWTNWTLLYGGDEFTLSGTYDIPIDEAAETVKMYYAFFPEVLEFQNWCVDFAMDHGYIESVFGRREYLPYISDTRDKGAANADARSAKNMPVQSAASDTLTLALAIIDQEFIKHELKSLLVNTVHDSILVDCHPDEIDRVYEICKDVMEHVADYAKVYMPDVDFSWLRVPLKVDAEVGTHYGSLMDYEEWKEINHEHN